MKNHLIFFSVLVAAISITAYFVRDLDFKLLQTAIVSSSAFATIASHFPLGLIPGNISSLVAKSSTQVASATDPEGTSYPWDFEPLVATNMSVARGIRSVVQAIEQAEGAGARVRRSIGTPQLRNLTPFLMLDHFTIKPGAGFPDHPHRGQETITYMLSGAVDHEDFTGARGTIEAGDLQFMTAGKGAVHAEMPSQNHPVSVGMQLWVDLPLKYKKCEPRYRDLKAAEIPLAKSEDGLVEVKVISGQAFGVDSVKDLAYTPVWYLHVTIKPGGSLKQPIPAGWNTFAYTLEGTALFGAEAKKVEKYNNVVFEQKGDVVEVTVPADVQEAAQFVLIAGEVHDQPIVQYGPFVVTSKEEVYQAIMDYQTHSNGFERANGWQSEIGKSMMG